MVLGHDIETLAARLSRDRQFELSSQLRRASCSIPSNIAEGQQRTTRVYINHLLIALGSEAELQTQLKLVARLKLIPSGDIESLLERTAEIGRMLRGLVRSSREHIERNSEH